MGGACRISSNAPHCCAESVGPADLDPSIGSARYVRGQRHHHDASHPAEHRASADIADYSAR
jgi:hypothetical protein